MDMRDRVKNIFVDCLGISADIVTDDLDCASIPQWDSISQMSVIVGLEDEFDIIIEADDVIEMSSVKNALEIVNKHLDSSDGK